MQNLTDQTFPVLLQKETVPCVIHIWSKSSETTQQVDAVLSALASDYGEKVNFAKLNADENPQTVSTFHINRFPNILFFHHNKLEYRVVRPMPKWQIEGIIDRILGEFG